MYPQMLNTLYPAEINNITNEIAEPHDDAFWGDSTKDY